MNYENISQKTVGQLFESNRSLQESPIDKSVLILVELRTSQINGCAFCCGSHSNEARNNNISQEKLDQLVAWRLAPHLFSDQEKAALEWCEAITNLDTNLSDIKKLLSKHYSERELVDLTASIAIMNALNRMEISLRN